MRAFVLCVAMAGGSALRRSFWRAGPCALLPLAGRERQKEERRSPFTDARRPAVFAPVVQENPLV